MQCACLSLWFRISKKILSPFPNIYSGVHQYHFHSSVFASCIICIDIEDCPYVSLCDPTRLSHNIREAYYTLAVKISTTMTMFSIKQICVGQLIIGRNSTKCYNQYQNIPCPRMDFVRNIAFLSSFFLIFNSFLSICISGKVQKVQQLIRWEHFGITFLARLISYNCSQLWAAISRTCKQE